MNMQKTSLHTYFERIPDPRLNRNKKHLLCDIVILSILGVLCGAESWDAIELFGKTKLEFLKTILKLPNGIPSHDTINRVFSLISPQSFERMFVEWTQSLKNADIGREVIAIDGKTVKGSKDGFHEIRPIHMVSAWASDNGLVLGQLKVDMKSNEITAIPLLLDMLDIKGEIVTIDAMGTQTKIADKIIENEADYILSVKGNQKEMLEQVEHAFERQKADSEDETVEKGHGRIETRRCGVIRDLKFIDGRERWTNMASIVKVEAKREVGNKTEEQVRYYISSMKGSASEFNRHIRAHWGVENSLHWTLDVVFNEDRQRKRTGNSAHNFSFIRKIGINLLKKDKSKGSLVSKRLKAGWDNKFLLDLLGI